MSQRSIPQTDREREFHRAERSQQRQHLDKLEKMSRRVWPRRRLPDQPISRLLYPAGDKHRAKLPDRTP